ncbi:MAG: hypothetical protein Q9P14_12150 [candidate division KSB1 bacterium]|nr:hypothetical protein [candidate division KSB1 bacterium]MDQ7065582.1 hypothetical protein [candidate division KSB1 bacterium]
MSHFIEFDELQEGQYLKIAGKLLPDSGFLAVEIVVEPSPGNDKIEAELQHVDLRRKRIKVLNQELPLEPVVEIRDADSGQTDWKALKPGTLVKIKGRYEDGRGFVPEKMKLKETLEFNVEELQGRLLFVDRTNRQLVVNGIPIRANGKTILLQA